MLYALLAPQYRAGAFYLDNCDEPVAAKKIPMSDEARKVLLEHFKEETSVA